MTWVVRKVGDKSKQKIAPKKALFLFRLLLSKWFHAYSAKQWVTDRQKDHWWSKWAFSCFSTSESLVSFKPNSLPRKRA
ncbi:hypothetical protein VCSRO121_0715 [Vibrio cholerae]|nr:hypothetical protein VCSRO121_0715 [Vibrio cholerae]